MLRLLRVRDFALISELEIEFGNGLCLLTGETGSGKSIIVDALSLLVGERSSPEMIRSQSQSAVVEGLFTVEGNDAVASLLDGAGVPADGPDLLVRREISASGRGRVFVNNALATVGLLREIGRHIVDIHGQHDRQTLLDLGTHLGWLDAFGGNSETLASVAGCWGNLKSVASRLDSMKMDEQERLRRIDMLQFQLKEIRTVGPSTELKESLESEERILSNYEKIAALVAEAYGSLYESESAILAQSNRVHRILQDLERFDPAWTSQRESVREALFRLEDVAYALRDYAGKLDYSPGRLDEVQQKLSGIDRLLRKYGATVPEVLAHAETCERELAGLETLSDKRRELEEEFESELSRYREIAGKLSARRHKDAARFEREIRAELSILAMEKTDLRVVFHPAPGDAGQPDGGLPAGCGPTGMDHAEFLVSANRGEEPRPLARIASGGELSRIMLAIKTICGAGRARTMVFDEVDAGIGGRVAELVGKRLRSIAAGGQVLCVTHLPQIAAFADEHYRVWKDSVGGRTETFAARLEEDGRLEEIARMLGGENVAETALGHARGLVAAAARSTAAGKKG